MNCHPERWAQSGVEGFEAENFINYLFFIMYKKLFFAAAVAATFAGCTKNEVNPVETPDLEISYQAIVNPKTKAGEPKFNEGHVFQSFAYYLTADKTWGANAADATTFIDGATISYNPTLGQWKDAVNSYYWPKNGKLTFLSWTLDKNDMTLPEGASAKCDKTKGVQITGFNLAASQDNLMVADVAADKTANENQYNYTGVPTLFRHKLCKVKCVVAAGADNPVGTTISVKSLAFGGVAQKGDYVQFPVDPVKEWTLTEDSRTDVNFTVPSTEIAPKGSVESDVLFFIPQTFADTQLVTVTYEVTDNAGITTGYTQTIALNNTEIFGTAGWNMNKFYTLTITIGLQEILWDPAEEEWVDENKGWTVA